MFNDEMLTIDEVAAFLKLKPQTIYKWAQSGKIPGAKFGKEWRFRRSSLEKWIDEAIPGGNSRGGNHGALESSEREAKPRDDSGLTPKKKRGPAGN